MMNSLKVLLLITVLSVIFMASNAFALSEFRASIKVSGGGAYDYFIIGMNEKATDGFDNAYDTMTMSSDGWTPTWVYAYMSHPEWGALKNEFRGDIRAVKKYDEWSIAVYSNLSPGTPLTMLILKDESSIPKGCSITVQDTDTGQLTELTGSSYDFSVPAGNIKYLTITVDNK